MIYAIEGINLALPTVNISLEESHRAGNLLKKKWEGEQQCQPFDQDGGYCRLLI
jgi:hypothetical protein